MGQHGSSVFIEPRDEVTFRERLRPLVARIATGLAIHSQVLTAKRLVHGYRHSTGRGFSNASDRRQSRTSRMVNSETARLESSASRRQHQILSFIGTISLLLIYRAAKTRPIYYRAESHRLNSKFLLNIAISTTSRRCIRHSISKIKQNISNKCIARDQTYSAIITLIKSLFNTSIRDRYLLVARVPSLTNLCNSWDRW
jgi:hypothetical protein